MDFNFTFKKFCIGLGILLWVLYLGYAPNPKPSHPGWESPDKSQWCLGYQYEKQKYRYHTKPEKLPTKARNIRAHHDEFDLNENGNFTREQVKDIENYIDSKISHDSYDIEDIIDNLEYYR